jgi:hypothetical protein
MNRQLYLQLVEEKIPIREINNRNVGSEVLTAVVMKSTIFWDLTACSPLKVNRRLGGTYRLHLRGLQALLATCFHTGFLLGLFFDPEDGGDMFFRNVG